MSNLPSAMYFLEKLKEGDAIEVEFIKKDGSLRRMKCTLNFDKIPLDKRPKKTTLLEILKQVETNEILRVFDIEKSEWRSVPFKTVIFKGIVSPPGG